MMAWIPLLIFTIAMEILSRLGIVPSYLFPAPSAIVRVFFQEQSENLVLAMGQTLLGAVLGWTLSGIMGLGLAMLMSIQPIVKRMMLPYAVFFQTVPVIAVAPILVVWFGFGMPTVIASAFLCSIFPVIAAGILGLEAAEPGWIEWFQLSGASRLQILMRCRVPASLPSVMSGLRVAAGLSVIGAVVGEFVGGGGLGGVIDSARSQQRMDWVFASVGLTSLIGLGMVSGVRLLSLLSIGAWYDSKFRVK
jgi:NitT/TauT family transport system permease protein